MADKSNAYTREAEDKAVSAALKERARSVPVSPFLTFTALAARFMDRRMHKQEAAAIEPQRSATHECDVQLFGVAERHARLLAQITEVINRPTDTFHRDGWREPDPADVKKRLAHIRAILEQP